MQTTSLPAITARSSNPAPGTFGKIARAFGLGRGKSKAVPGGLPAVSMPARRGAPQSQYMRDSSGGYLNAWRPWLRDSQDDVRSHWYIGASRATDSLHNSGWLSGAIDQASADTIGTGLRLNATPDYEALGWTQDYARKWCRKVERRWKAWSSNPLECDARGRRTIADMTDAAIRYHYAMGEATALLPSIERAESRSRLKVLMFSPHRLVMNTNETIRQFQGVTLDHNGMPFSYRLRRKVDGIEQYLDIKARSDDGRPQVIHVFDGAPDQVRGMTPLAPVLLRFRQYDQLSDATLTATMLQTVIAATIKSEGLSDDVFQALQTSNETGKESENEIPTDIQGFLDAKLSWWKNRTIDLGTSGRVAHLFPGEELDMKSAAGPHNNYLAYSRSLLREIARCVGTTYESMTGDYEGATYSSVRMAISAIWFITMRRRNRIAIPFVSPIYARWLDEEIQTGRIDFKGGYAKFQRMRCEATQADWSGPAKPTADDFKSAKAATERLGNGTTTLTYEMGEYGLDVETVMEQRHQEREMAKLYGLPDPYPPPVPPGQVGRPPKNKTAIDPAELEEDA